MLDVISRVCCVWKVILWLEMEAGIEEEGRVVVGMGERRDHSLPPGTMALWEDWEHVEEEAREREDRF